MPLTLCPFLGVSPPPSLLLDLMLVLMDGALALMSEHLGLFPSVCITLACVPAIAFLILFPNRELQALGQMS